MSVRELLQRIEGVSVLSGDPLRLQGLQYAEDGDALAEAGDVFSPEDPVADLDGVVKGTAGQAEVPIRTGILRRG